MQLDVTKHGQLLRVGENKRNILRKKNCVELTVYKIL